MSPAKTTGLPFGPHKNRRVTLRFTPQRWQSTFLAQCILMISRKKGWFFMGELRLPILYEIQNCLNYYGFENEIRNNTFYGPYVNIGSRRYRAERVQFWYDEEQCVTRVLAGKNMGRWYAEGIQSEFKRKWREEVDKECIVEFPHLFLVFNYIRQVSDNK